MSRLSTEALQQLIRDRYGCGSRFVRTESVALTVDGRTLWLGFHGGTLWKGDVQVFNLIDHPTASRAYVWVRDPDEQDRDRFVVVLHSTQVDSAETAARFALGSEVRARYR